MVRQSVGKCSHSVDLARLSEGDCLFALQYKKPQHLRPCFITDIQHLISIVHGLQQLYGIRTLGKLYKTHKQQDLSNCVTCHSRQQT